MRTALIDKIRKRLSGAVLVAEPLGHHTTYRVGGEAEMLAAPASREEAEWLYRLARREGLPLTVLGAGSNVIAPDAGIAGLVLQMRQTSGPIDFANDRRVRADAGVLLADLVNAAAARGCGGLEPLAGIPGTVGGAVVMNAGTRDTDTASFLAAVEFITPSGERRTFVKEDLSFGYRRSIFQGSGWLVLGAEFHLRRAEPAESRRLIEEYVADRKQKYPMDVPSAGSVFKRPPVGYPGRLIEEAGCKGMRVGGAIVSERHANFIVNSGGATAADIVELIARVRARVLETAGICLELEQIVL